MMNIDDALRVMPDEIRRQDLHVARQHDEIDAVFSQKLQLLPLGLGFVLFGEGNDSRECGKTRRRAGHRGGC